MDKDYNFLSIEEIYQKIGENLRIFRKVYNLRHFDQQITQAKLAELADVSVSTIGNLESEKTKQGISFYNLYKISVILEIPIDNFIKETDLSIFKDIDLQ